MPRLNGTGPEGRGSMTGRGLGQCNRVVVASNSTENNVDVSANTTEPTNNLNNNFRGPNFNNPMGGFTRGLGQGRGLGLGRGRGRGFAQNGRRGRGNF